jgi:antitoxin component YwqK of YwqJK toxin-antitoxin module
MPKAATTKSGSKKYTHYHKDGTVWAKGKLIGDKMDGPWVWFRKDGSKMRSGHFTKGVQTGEWTTYDKSGKVVKVTKKGTK